MKSFKYAAAASAVCSLLLTGCDEAIVKSSEEVSPTLLWQGVLPAEPDSAKTNWVYFDSEEEVTLIYNGESWDTLAVSGIDGTPITWLGPLSAFPIQKKVNIAFFHKTEKVSYICDGEEWNILSVTGKDGTGVKWLGDLDQPPTAPDLLTSYYDTVLKCSRIWNGSEWESFAIDGINGIALNWLGSAEGYPDSPAENDAFYNSAEGISYIWDGSDWMVLSRDGLIGKSGEIIQWQGEFPEDPEMPKNNWAYYNTTNGNCYIFNNERWNLLSHAAKNGSAITWRGILEEGPEKPSINDVYRSIKDGNAYIFNGSGWELFCEGGINGENGLDGLDIIWHGTHAEHPSPAEVNWVYYNYKEKVSYCYDGSTWQPMLKSGVDGFEITWLGEFYSDPIDGRPVYGSVYYNITDNMTYFWDGSDWVNFVKGGTKGMAGQSITWLGESTTHPVAYYQNSIYYNTKFRKTYVYRFGFWGDWIPDGTDGLDGMTNNSSSQQLVAPMDSITLYTFNKEGLIVPTGEYLGTDSMLHTVDMPSENWIGHLDLADLQPLCNTSYVYKSEMMHRRDESTIQIYGDTSGGRFFTVDQSGTMGAPTVFTTSTPYHLSSAELPDGTLLFAYVDDNSDGQLTKVTPANEIITVPLTPGMKTTELDMVLRSDGTPFIIYRDESYQNYGASLNVTEMTITTPILLNESIGSVTLCPLNDGTMAVASIDDGVYVQIINGTDIIREFTVGKSDAKDISSITQTDHGVINISYNRRYRYSYVAWRSVAVLLMVTPDGTVQNSFDMIDKPVYDISVHKSSQGIDVFFSSEGKSYLQYYDGGLEQIYSYQLKRSLNQPSLQKVADDEYIVTGVGPDNKGLFFGKINRSSEDISVKLKRIKDNAYTLINHTGSHIYLKLTLCRYEDKGN